MAAFVPKIDSGVADIISDRLNAIESDQNVRILFAVESGSRAWGFPSPDSDYDVRFVYAHPTDWYLTLVPGRDVIELPLEGELDINGWDVRKALNLLLRPNPVLLEWLSSPVRYRWQDRFCADLITLSKQVTHGKACLHHYLNLGSRQWKVYIADKDTVSLKKYFYVVRPAMAIRWLRLRPDSIPPMNFQELTDGMAVPNSLKDRLLALLEAKSQSKELGTAPRIKEIDDFVTDEFKWARGAAEHMHSRPRTLRKDADSLFRSIIRSA